ncbi:MAG: DUF3048 domain-containing protein [Coriobacteriia bacterium]|nr:DUF3048 domain-containing protein [Actinomycetota bacterium]MDZ4167263.1 DUF3048 domain-containing protein [Coriobacteriia bacterium]
MIHVRTAIAAIAVLLVGVVAGCSTTAEVVPGWPSAEAERTVPKPSEPLRWPLTGLDAPSEEAIAQRVVSVKIENSPAARPQSGLQQADVVYETIAEGGISRFNAMFHSQSPDPIGPVRSARLSDITVVPQYGALFVFSGGSDSVDAAVARARLENLSQDAGVSKPYYRSRERSAPHNLYLHLEEARAEAGRRNMSLTADPKPLAFDRSLPAVTEGQQVTEIDIPFSTANRVTWRFDEASGAYLRWNNGNVHNDALAGKQLSARNVVVIWARYIPQSRDKVGSATYDIELAGSGRMSLFRDGQRFDGTWEATKDAPPVFKAADGTQVKLGPGNTWYQVVATDVNITMQ